MVKINSLINEKFSAAEKEKINEALLLLEQVVNSDLFKNKVFSFNQPDKTPSFVMNNNKSNEEIYEQLMSGADKFETGRDYELDLEIVPFESKDMKQGGTYMGYVRMNARIIHLNNGYINSNHPVVTAGVILHEYMHNLDFHHDQGIGPFRKLIKEHDYTVPYALGFIVMEVSNELNKIKPGYKAATEADIKNCYTKTFNDLANRIANEVGN